MQKFKYTALTLQKEKISGIFMARDEQDLAVQLAKQNLYLVSAQSYRGGTPSSFFTLGTGKVKLSELTTFSRQFAIMVNSGISILGALGNLKGQSYSTYFRRLLETIYEDVKGGIMLSDALNKHKNVFPDFFRSMVYVGEQSGKLEIVFNSLADYYEQDAVIKRKARSALSYPIMLLFMTIGIVLLMLIFVIPTFRDALSSLEIEITGLTAVIYKISDFMLANWLYILAGVCVVSMLIVLILHTPKGKYAYHRFKLVCPYVRGIQLNMITARFARGFGLLLSSGMDIVDAMEAMQIVLGNLEFENRFKKATEDVRHGVSLTAAFEKYKLFPQMMIQMISVGEKTAKLDQVLNRSCNFFDEQVEISLSSLTSKIQPIMLLIMGGVVGTLFIAIYSPMLSIMTNLSH